MVSIEDAQRLTNIVVRRAALREQIDSLQKTVPDGTQPTKEDEIAERIENIEALNADHRSYTRAEYQETLTNLNTSLAGLQAQNAEIHLQNTALRSTLDAQIAGTQSALVALDTEEKNLLKSLSAGAPATNAPSIESRITALEDTVLTLGGV